MAITVYYDPILGALRASDANTGAIGETITGGTAGSVLYVGATGLLAQSPTNFTWDYTNNRLAINALNPQGALVVGGTQSGNAGFEIIAGSGIVVQSVNRTGGVYTSLNFDGDTIAVRPNGTTLWSAASGVVSVYGDTKVYSASKTFWYNSDSTNYYYIDNPGSTGSTNSILRFTQGNVGEVARFGTNGYFGIGTTPATYRLEVAGTSYSTTGFVVNNNQSYKAKNSSGTAIDVFYLDGSNILQFNAQSGGGYVFGVNATTAIEITSARQVNVPSILSVGAVTNSGYATSFASSNTTNLAAIYGIAYNVSGSQYYNAGVRGQAYLASGTGIGTGVYAVSDGPSSGTNVAGYFYAASATNNYAILTGGGNSGFGTNSPTALVDINSDIVRLRTAKTPASAAATGNAGDICWDSGYIYVCTATDTWKRVAIATW